MYLENAPTETFEVAVASAVPDFNDGGNGILNVIAKSGFPLWTLHSGERNLTARIKNMENKITVKCKQRKNWEQNVEVGWTVMMPKKSYSAGTF